ncbi:hypothetical protein JNB62_05225 [Microbacterium jejuense]|uniref:2'-5' RNA ligase family protein n=1 Tax=Microbacterium jejuense TaxID=1263637 RepID=A0ABS7HJE5_9MICO|nr:hypothetical protein [Microbacterium jejuense]MBW9093076.1 hypothetical protein [Microbacterium jejuense]
MTNTRYGIFLRPDPATCWAVTQITLALKQQFGIVAAAAFAPHATLIGNLQIDTPLENLVTTLTPIFERTRPIQVFNHGVHRSGRSIRYDINRDETGEHDNAPLQAMAEAVRTAVLPLHVRHDDFLAPNVQEYRFAAHLTLAGFDLDVEPRLTEEVHDYIAGLPIVAPSSFTLHWLSLFEFHADWRGEWWRAMTSRHIHSWEVCE